MSKNLINTIRVTLEIKLDDNYIDCPVNLLDVERAIKNADNCIKDVKTISWE